MRLQQIESWALDIVDRVKTGQPFEDSRVELKICWPTDLYRAARHIAGLANAAHGAPVLWVIGVDEETGVEGATKEELADWFPRVGKFFDDVVPEMTDVNVRVDAKVIVALLFETERAPFVVRNPLFGAQKGVRISHEVPWREGTSTRSARRSDLVRLLVTEASIREERAKKHHILRLLSDELSYNHETLAAREYGPEGQAAVPLRALQPPLRDDSWDALRVGDQLECIRDPKILGSLAGAYRQTADIIKLEKRLFERYTAADSGGLSGRGIGHDILNILRKMRLATRDALEVLLHEIQGQLDDKESQDSPVVRP